MLRRIAQVLLVVVTVVVATGAAAVIFSQTPWFKEWLRGVVVRQADKYLNGQLSIGRLGGNLFTGVHLEDVGLRMSGQPMIQVKDARIEYDVRQIVSHHLVIGNIRLTRPVIHLRRDESGWNLGHLVRPRPKGNAPPRTVTLSDIAVTDGEVVIDTPVGTGGVSVPGRLDRVDAKVTFESEPARSTIGIAQLSFRGASPDFGVHAMSGRIAVRGDDLYLEKLAIRTEESSLGIDGRIDRYVRTPTFDVRITSDKLAIAEVGRLVHALADMRVESTLRVTAKGPLHALAFDVDMKSSTGDVLGQMTADLAARSPRLAGSAHVRSLDLAPILKTPADQTDITGFTRFDLQFVRSEATVSVVGTYAVDAAHVSALGYEARNVKGTGRIDGTRIALAVQALAYGANATASGVLDRKAVARGRTAFTYDLAGGVQHGDLRELPPFLHVPRAASRLDLDYHVIGTGPAAHGDVTMRPSMLAGATLGEGTTGSFEVDGRAVNYAAKGAVAGLDLVKVGHNFNIAALEAAQYRSELTGMFDVHGAGTTLDTLRIDATGQLVNSQIFQAARVPAMGFEAHLADRRLDVKARGQVANLNPAVALGGSAVSGAITGSVDGELVLSELGQPVFPDRIAFTGGVDLQQSSLNGVRIDRATIRGRYADRVGRFDQLEVTGPDGQGRASGTIALDTRSASDLSYHVESSRLDAIGKIVNQPLKGSAVVDGRVTGNATSLKTAGTLNAAGAGYGSFDALKLGSQFDLELPDLSPQRLKATADTSGTFVTLGGQQINELRVRASYADQQVTFDLGASKAPRSLDAAGVLLLHPDHQEVHLRQLVLKTQGQEWKTANDTGALQYRQGMITAKDLRLVSGGQQIAVQGSFGRAGTELSADLTAVDLSRVDTLLLGETKLAGLLNGKAVVTGTTASPSVAGSFAITNGAFRQFKYQSLGGTINYAKDAISLDVKLLENPSAWITARGLLPLAVFRAPAPGAKPSTTEVDLQIQSSPLDLGLVQGFTDQLQKVTGTLNANLRMSGPATSPVMTGHVDVRNAALTVVPTGVSYKDLEAGIILQPNQLIIEGLRIVDSDGQSLQLGGTLGVQTRELGAVNLKIIGKDFKLLDNDYGKIRLSPNVTVSGDLRRPQVRGEIGVSNGQINIDPILAEIGTSAYSTTPTTVQSAPEAPAGASAPTATGGRGVSGVPPLTGGGRGNSASAQPQQNPPTPPGRRPPPTGIYGATTMDVRVRIPDDLAVKGQDLRVGQAPIGLGAVNVTLGGELHITKAADRDYRLQGQINTVRGTYNFQGRRFDIVRDGNVRFEGQSTINPDLDIRANRIISGVEARVNVRGTLREPELTLSSQPPLDEADILSLIIFNAPSNELGQGQRVSLAQRAGEMATGFAAGKLADSIGRALGLDVFEISTTTEAGTGAGAAVTVGHQIGQNLFVKLKQGVGADNVSQFVLDYQFAAFARLETTMSQGGTTTQSLLRRTERGGVDLIFFFSY